MENILFKEKYNSLIHFSFPKTITVGDCPGTPPSIVKNFSRRFCLGHEHLPPPGTTLDGKLVALLSGGKMGTTYHAVAAADVGAYTHSEPREGTVNRWKNESCEFSQR
ncbi:conserved Plasmodium protein, unknown function [Plasmodium ovale wallikeri]|uniref:Uncharacterized protein n=1 Tax=Plasmodium ovale wallikeri TaxID=864142 RepID=A0A1A8YHB1_PLAOA|nr:conserved Plasmodium protein, unknown function [Plasmodium ovale wallikeri]